MVELARVKKDHKRFRKIYHNNIRSGIGNYNLATVDHRFVQVPAGVQRRRCTIETSGNCIWCRFMA